jgi:NAD(P)-dependent dehydrogenase (short-subunit alcohol dehydrogenase family)
MSHSSYRTALIVGAGSGLSASIARAFAEADMSVALAARTIEDLAPVAAETGAKSFVCDATDRDQVTELFAGVSESIGAPRPLSTMRAIAFAGRSPSSTRPKSKNPSRFRRSAASWSRRRRCGAC